MKIARYAHGDDIAYGVVEGLEPGDEPGPDTFLAQLHGHPIEGLNPTGIRHSYAEIRLLPPVLPTKIVAMGKNYLDHIEEMGGETPEGPLIFLKPSTSLIGPGDRITLPYQSNHVDHEGELAVIIARPCRDLPARRAREVILGYTCANDVSARDLQQADGQWTRAKGFDSFCPLGPWIETELDVLGTGGVDLSCRVGDDVRQSSNTALLIHRIPQIIEFITSVMTLLPGDVILTGTPAGVGPLTAGDTVTVSIAGIGSLTNPVVNRD